MEIPLFDQFPEFSVLIVNYNGGDFVQRALDSLAVQTRRDFEVILVDNASSDGSAEGLDTSELPAFRLMAEAENHGFARANNLAAEVATGRWLVFLNPDAMAGPDWLEKISEGMTRYPAVRMFASAQLDLLDKTRLDGAGDAYLIFGIPWRGGFGRPASELPGEGECFSPCGAGAAFDRETFREHGGFDEQFFCFCEDVDLGFRLRLAGETCVFLPEAVIHHVGGGLSGRASDFAIYHGARNRVWTYFKNMPLPLLVLTLPGHVVLSVYILARGLMTGRVRQTWRGMRDGVRGLPALQARPGARQPRSVSLWQLARSMAWNPFRMSQRKVHVREFGSEPPLNRSSGSTGP
jgi:GT2 family glycosyltransferase